MLNVTGVPPPKSTVLALNISPTTYPLPILVNATAVTIPFVINTSPLAPVPLPPVNGTSS